MTYISCKKKVFLIKIVICVRAINIIYGESYAIYSIMSSEKGCSWSGDIMKNVKVQVR